MPCLNMAGRIEPNFILEVVPGRSDVELNGTGHAGLAIALNIFDRALAQPEFLRDKPTGSHRSTLVAAMLGITVFLKSVILVQELHRMAMVWLRSSISFGPGPGFAFGGPSIKHSQTNA